MIRSTCSMLLLALSSPVACFTSPSVQLRVPTSTHQYSCSSCSSSQLEMLPKHLISLLESKPLHSGSGGSSSSSNLALPALLTAPFGITGLASSEMSDPSVEAQVLTDISHLGLDLAAFLGPGAIALRMAAVLGRLATMAADFIPDHSMHPEELLFQSFMLTVAVVGLAKSTLLPAYSSRMTNVTLRDGKAFNALFAPAGTSWDHFKAVKVCALDWITIQAGDTVNNNKGVVDNSNDGNDNEYLYWLYSGAVQVESQEGKTLYNVARKSGGISKDNAASGLLGEGRLLRRLERKSSSSKSKTKSSSTNISAPTATTDESFIRATETTTLLRIHAPSLKLLMDNDATLADSIRTLLFQGMEAKLNAQLAQLASRSTAAAPAFNVTA